MKNNRICAALTRMGEGFKLCNNAARDGSRYCTKHLPLNEFGCYPVEDVCLTHDLPLEDENGCERRDAKERE